MVILAVGLLVPITLLLAGVVCFTLEDFIDFPDIDDQELYESGAHALCTGFLLLLGEALIGVISVCI